MEQYARELASDVDPPRLEAALLKRKDDIGEAIGELESLIEDGSAFAMAALGNIYLYGSFGIQADEQKGEELLTGAAALGSVEGTYRLACFLDSKARHAEAFALYDSLASAKFSPALYRLGWAYQDGRWVDQDTSRARSLFLEASRQGHLLSHQKLSYDLRKSSKVSDRLHGLVLLVTLIGPRAWLHRRQPMSDRLRD